MHKPLHYRHTICACTLGYVTQAVINNLAPLLFLIFNNQFGIPLSRITVLITVNFCIQLLVDFLAARYADRIGHRTCMVMSHVLCALGLGGMAVLPFILSSPFVGLLISISICAVGGGILEVLVSPLVEACPTQNKAGIMGLLHSFYCWGTVVVIVLSTLFLHVFGKGSWRILCLLWTILPLCNAVYFTRVPIYLLTEEGEGMRAKELFANKTFWLFMILMITAGASEQAMSQWASAFAEKGLQVSKTVGDLLGPCLFSICMGTSRVLYARYSDRVDLTAFILGSGILSVISYIIAAVAPVPALSLIGCGLCGVGVGILWPGIFSVAAVRFPKGGTALFAFLALAGDLGCSSGPTSVGIVSAIFGDQLKAGLLFAIVFPLVLIVCTLAYRRQR